ncbi:secretoglobin family 3A member 2 [Octodon degus]|uniref:Secretoglobin family 3A member 2 n=1 Tax=Octodon degus TaxID=10160 RepID=A0A6P3F7W4_OCTDE|nr:secretoglobin family 3A member 2 [Octodon degus]
MHVCVQTRHTHCTASKARGSLDALGFRNSRGLSHSLAMKLATVFLLVTISVCSYSATAFLFNLLPAPIDNMLPLDVLALLDPLKRLLQALGISVEHLVEGLRKCVNELGPEASESVKKLLEALSHLV